MSGPHLPVESTVLCGLVGSFSLPCRPPQQQRSATADGLTTISHRLFSVSRRKNCWCGSSSRAQRKSPERADRRGLDQFNLRRKERLRKQNGIDDVNHAIGSHYVRLCHCRAADHHFAILDRCGEFLAVVIMAGKRLYSIGHAPSPADWRRGRGVPADSRKRAASQTDSKRE